MASGASAVVRAADGAALDGAVTPIPASYTQTRPVHTLTMQLTSAEDIMRIMVSTLSDVSRHHVTIFSSPRVAVPVLTLAA